MTTQLSAREAAAVLGCVPSTVRDLCREGRLRATKNKSGYWQVDAAFCREFAKTYTPDKRQFNLNKRAFDVPVGRGRQTKRNGAGPKWATLDEQIKATMNGDIRPVYLSANGEVIR